MGVEIVARVTANMAEGRFGKRFSTAELKEIMAVEIARIMEPVARPLPLYRKTPQVVLVVGVGCAHAPPPQPELVLEEVAVGSWPALADDLDGAFNLARFVT